MTLSIAAPASFWYLKQFPIAKMHSLLDYIVYMTYDLHGMPEPFEFDCRNGKLTRKKASGTPETPGRAPGARLETVCDPTSTGQRRTTPWP